RSGSKRRRRTGSRACSASRPGGVRHISIHYTLRFSLSRSKAFVYTGRIQRQSTGHQSMPKNRDVLLRDVIDRFTTDLAAVISRQVQQQLSAAVAKLAPQAARALNAAGDKIDR